MKALIFLAAAVISGCSSKRADQDATNPQRFERELLKPAPATVTDIRYDEDLMGDPAYFLSFRCTPADVERIIAEKKFVPGSPLINSGTRPSWWKMAELGGSPVTYNISEKPSVATLWVSENRTLCYYIKWVL